ncbi:MAG: hypothetical protein O2816_17960 [Planctomycetota bacterium]|nr:hypothetical protein [Planctomycetota bacterium]
MSAHDPSEFDSGDLDLGPPRGPGPVVLILPVLVFVCVLLWMRHGRERDGGATPAPPAETTGLEVAGWRGVASVSGAQLDVRLMPLHADARRQAFDQEVFAELLSPGEGQPWQLELRYAAPGASAPDLPLAQVVVRDGAGAQLRPLRGDVPRLLEGRAADPLHALLALPAEPLAPGESLTLVLWGTAPGAGARLEIGDLRCDLSATRIASTDVPRTLATLDRGDAR